MRGCGAARQISACESTYSCFYEIFTYCFNHAVNLDQNQHSRKNGKKLSIRCRIQFLLYINAHKQETGIKWIDHEKVHSNKQVTDEKHFLDAKQ